MRGMFPESDWKLYRKKIPEIGERIKDDKKKSGVQVRMSRSEMLYDILSLINEGAIQ